MTPLPEPSPVVVAAVAAAGGPNVESRGESLRRLTDDLGTAVVEGAWLLALICVPVYFNIYSSRSFEPDKVAVLTVLAGVIAAAWLARVLAGGSFWPPAASPGGHHRAGIGLLVAAAAFLAASALATALSVSPLRSWHGSFFRQQGLTTLLAYLTIALAVAAHLRRAAQWRRAALAITLGSVPVCAYAIVQRLGLDTIGAADDELRVSSSLGNPIFLGGYVALAFLVTVCSVAVRESGGRSVARRLGLALVALVQLATLVLSQSRGPLLGLCAGVFVLALAATLHARGERGPAPGAGWRRHGWTLVVAGGAAALALLALLAVPDSPLAAVRRLPVAGRLAAALDPTVPTARVRLLIWRGVVELATVAPPLRGASGEADRLHRLRGLVGYGPDCFDLAFNRVFPPELGRVERRDSIPDRAHCETFDLLTGSGTLGLGAWLALLAGAFAVGATRAVRGADDRHAVRRTFAIALAAAVAAAAAAILAGRADLAGVLAPVGLLAGVCAGMVRTGLDAPSVSPAAPERRLVLATLAAGACHVVEVSVGIPVTSSRLLFWFLLAALVAVSFRRLDPGRADDPADLDSPRSGSQETILAALLAAVALAATLYTLMDRTVLEAVLALTAGLPSSPFASLRAAGSAVAVLAIAAPVAAVTVWAHGAAGRSSRAARLAALGAAVLPVLALAVLKSHRLAASARMQHDGSGLGRLSEHVAGHVGAFCVALIALVFLVAVLLLWHERERTGLRPTPLVLVGAVMLGFVAVVTTLLARQALAPIRADTLAKHAAALIVGNQPLAALRLLVTASWLAPGEPSLLTLIARATVLATRAPLSPAGRLAAAEAGAGALELAGRMQPLDPDHAVNLGRVLTSSAAIAADATARRVLLERAERAYARGLDLRPGSVLFRVERAGALARLGDDEAATAELAAVLAVDPGYETGALMLAGLEHARAVAALRAGREAEARRHLEGALGALEGLLAQQGGHPVAERAVAALYARLGRGDQAVSALEGLVDGSEPASVHEMLALLHLEAGRTARAVAEAEAAVRGAGADGRPHAEATLALVRSRAGKTLPEEGFTRP